jgi:1,4-dihydroxy-2-naphthoyl-CoA hydrolase
MADPLEQVRAATRGLFGDYLGVRLVEASPDGVVAELAVRDELCTTPGIMHGGAMMGLADHLGGIATFLNLPPGAGTTTIESKTNFFAPGRTGETVRAECRPLHRGRRTMVWQTRISGPDGRLLALVTQTQIVLEARQSPQDVLTSLFAGKSAAEQKALLATLERGGAAVYRALAEQEADPAAKQALLEAARKEEENAATLERQA